VCVVRSLPWRLRWSVLSLLAALGVHAGRYAAAGDGHGDEHAYLFFATPLLAGLALLGCLEFGLALRRVRRGRAAVAAAPPATWRVWVTTTMVLMGVYVVQETGEALLGGGHAHELFALFGADAWTVVPLAMVAALLVALALHGAVAAIAWVARDRTSALRAPQRVVPHPPRVVGRRRGVLCRRLAGRGPPALTTGA
jgi:hypothetical protein